MNIRTGIALTVAAGFLLASFAGYAQGGSGGGHSAQRPTQMQPGPAAADQGRRSDVQPAHQRDRTRDQDRTHRPDFESLENRDIYGSELMTKQERKRYRKELSQAASDGERARVEKRHQEQMHKRAEQRGVTIEPPGKDIYGGGLMSVEERNRYREQLRLIGKDEEKRTRFMADHKQKMQRRANSLGIDIDEPSEEAE